MQFSTGNTPCCSLVYLVVGRSRDDFQVEPTSKLLYGWGVSVIPDSTDAPPLLWFPLS